MKEAIMNLIDGDEEKYNLAMIKTRRSDSVSPRWEIIRALKADGHSLSSIARHFNISFATAKHAAETPTPYPTRPAFSKIPAALIRELQTEMFANLNERGYSHLLIAKTFKMERSTVSRAIKTYNDRCELKEKRKHIKKIR